MKNIVLSLVALFIVSSLLGQNEPVIMEINGKPVTKSEFLQIYLKNNNDPKYDKKTLDEYMELFVKFKLKVAEAEALGYDTIPKLKRELEGYRKSLATPFLVDNEKNEEMMKEAYARMQKEIKASHILVRVEETAPSKDTLIAYNKILAIKKRIEGGEDFTKVAKETSEDPSVAQNGGNLGYFTVFQMVYPFEDAAYNTPVGKVSSIVRTKFGYHILKVFDIREARGTMTAAHIMISTSKDDDEAMINDARKKATEIVEKLRNGEDFAQLCKMFSDDFNTNERGGVLSPFGSGTTTRMLPEFEDAAFQLKNNDDISEPVQTPYGFHIIKRISWKPVSSYESMQKDLQNKVKRDDRAKKTQDYFVEKLKKEYQFKDLSKKSLKPFYKAIDSTYFVGQWDKSKIKSDKALFELNGKTYNQQGFVNFLQRNYGSVGKTDIKDLVNIQFQKWQKEEVLAYEDGRLEEKHPEFKALMQEYHDGILLYEIMSDKVWNFASKDTSGLKAFYEANQSNYMWKERVDAAVYECLDGTIAQNVHKILKEGKLSSSEIVTKINESSELNLRVRNNKFEIEETPFLKGKSFTKGLQMPYEVDGKFFVVMVNEVLPKGNKSFDESKGAITADYQNLLEKQWIEELNKKHKVTINKEALYSIGK